MKINEIEIKEGEELRIVLSREANGDSKVYPIHKQTIGVGVTDDGKFYINKYGSEISTYKTSIGQEVLEECYNDIDAKKLERELFNNESKED